MTEVEALCATPGELEGYVREHARYVADCLQKSPSTDWTPMLAVWTRREPGAPVALLLHALAVSFNEDNEKRPLLFALGKRMWAEDKTFPTAILLSSEAWAAPDHSGESGQHVQPRDSPERREVIVIHATSLDMTIQAMCMAPVTRDEGNQIVPGEFGEIIASWHEGQRVETRLLNHFVYGFFDETAKRMEGQG
jgi:hypothetical protein